VEVDHLADLAREAEEEREVGGVGGGGGRGEGEGGMRERVRAEGVFLEGQEGLAEVLLGERQDGIFGEVEEPLDVKPALRGRGWYAAAFIWRGRRRLARGCAHVLVFGGSHREVQFGILQGALEVVWWECIHISLRCRERWSLKVLPVR
jgi:hypothetical protein